MNWSDVADWLSWICLALGSILCIIGAVGLLRLPDFFTRIHAASIIDSLGAILILLGLAFQSNWDINLLKIGLVLVFMIVTGPTAIHALAKSAIYDGYKPYLKDKEKQEDAS